jgi:hypothetical protein
LLVRKETVTDLGGFDTSFDRHQDLEFTIRLLKQGKLAHVNQPLVTIHESTTPDAESVEFTKMKYFSKFEDDVVRLQAEGEPVLGRHWYELSKFYFQEAKFIRGLQYLFGADVAGPLQYAGLCHAVGTGVYRRLQSE